MTTHELIDQLIESLETTNQSPSLAYVSRLCMAIHKSMERANVAEVLWMEPSLEDFVMGIPAAERCAAIEADREECEAERRVKEFRMNGGL